MCYDVYKIIVEIRNRNTQTDIKYAIIYGINKQKIK